MDAPPVHRGSGSSGAPPPSPPRLTVSLVLLGHGATAGRDWGAGREGVSVLPWPPHLTLPPDTPTGSSRLELRGDLGRSPRGQAAEYRAGPGARRSRVHQTWRRHQCTKDPQTTPASCPPGRPALGSRGSSGASSRLQARSSGPPAGGGEGLPPAGKRVESMVPSVHPKPSPVASAVQSPRRRVISKL